MTPGFWKLELKIATCVSQVQVEELMDFSGTALYSSFLTEARSSGIKGEIDVAYLGFSQLELNLIWRPNLSRELQLSESSDNQDPRLDGTIEDQSLGAKVRYFSYLR